MKTNETLKINFLDENDNVLQTLTIVSNECQYEVPNIREYLIADMIDFIQWYCNYKISKTYHLVRNDYKLNGVI